MPDTEEEMVDIPSEGKSVNIEVNKDDIPEEIATSTGQDVESDDSEEHQDYSKKVQKRIDKLTKKAREAERQQEAALNFARNVQQENQALKGKVQNLDVGYVNEYGDRIASQEESLERELETAIATSDTAAQVEVQKKLSQLAIEKERVRAAKAEQKRIQESASVEIAQNNQQVAPPPSRPDPEAEDWAQKNKWFGEDDAMTFAAFGIHKTLVEQEGFDTSAPEYYAEIDKRIREAFPHKFNSGSQEVSVTEDRRPQQSVASATRSSNAGRKTVKLSPSEVAIAAKLGVPLDEYAKYKR